MPCPTLFRNQDVDVVPTWQECMKRSPSCYMVGTTKRPKGGWRFKNE